MLFSGRPATSNKKRVGVRKKEITMGNLANFKACRSRVLGFGIAMTMDFDDMVLKFDTNLPPPVKIDSDNDMTSLRHLCQDHGSLH